MTLTPAQRRIPSVVLAVIALSLGLGGCALLPAAEVTHVTDFPPTSATPAPVVTEETAPTPAPLSGCAALPFADALAAAIGATEPATIVGNTLEADGERLIVGCQVVGEPRTDAPDKSQNVLSVQYRLDYTQCSPKPVGTPDPEVSGAVSLTAANGGIAYYLCTPAGAEISVTYVSVVDIPGPDLGTVRAIALTAVASEADFAAVGREALK